MFGYLYAKPMGSVAQSEDEPAGPPPPSPAGVTGRHASRRARAKPDALNGPSTSRQGGDPIETVEACGFPAFSFTTAEKRAFSGHALDMDVWIAG